MFTTKLTFNGNSMCLSILLTDFHLIVKAAIFILLPLCAYSGPKCCYLMLKFSIFYHLILLPFLCHNLSIFDFYVIICNRSKRIKEL